MFNIFQNTSRPDKNLFFSKNDPNDLRLGETVSSDSESYSASDIVILGCPQDEGVARNKGRTGAALAPNSIREQFYKLTDFGIEKNIFDLGDTLIQPSLEETHALQTKIVKQILRDNKKLVILGGGNDISYADGSAVSGVFGKNKWQAINVDAHFDVRAEKRRNSGTPYRQLLDENLLEPLNFFEIAWQPQVNSNIYYSFLLNAGVKLLSLSELKKEVFAKNDDFERLKILLENENSEAVFWGFDADAIRVCDAPGVSAANPVGLSADEFIRLVDFAKNFPKTKVVEFTEVNPNFDIDNRTAKLIALAMHRFCAE